MKSIFFFTGTILLVLPSYYVQALSVTPGNIIPPTAGGDIVSSGETGTGLLDYVLASFRDFVFGILMLIAVGVFLYIGARLVIARGNPEEFSKALKSFIYAAIGIFVVVFAWAAVRLVSGISL